MERVENINKSIQYVNVMKKAELTEFLDKNVAEIFHQIGMPLYIDILKQAFKERRYSDVLQYTEIAHYRIMVEYSKLKNKGDLDIFEKEVKKLVK